MKVAICFLTNKINDDTVDFIRKSLIHQCETNVSDIQYDFYTLYDSNEIINDQKIITFNWSNLKKTYNITRVISDKEYVGMCCLPLFYLSDLHNEYDYYLFWEDDLLYTGFFNDHSIFDVLDKYIKFYDYDICFTDERQIAVHYKWNTWFWRQKGRYSINKKWKIYNYLLNTYVISKNALTDLKRFYTCGKYFGHHELIVNTFFYNQRDKYKIQTFDKYINVFTKWYNDTTYKNLSTINDNWLIHPVKTQEILNDLKSKFQI